MGTFSKDGTTVTSADTVDGKPPGAFGFPQETQVFGPGNLPAPAQAPDTIIRVPIKLGEKYIIRASFKLPKLFLPRFDPANPNAVVEFVAGKRGIVLEIDGDDTPHIWGRNGCSVSFDDIRFVDVGNGGAGRSTRMFDVVGIGDPSVFFDLGRCQFTSMKRYGSVVDYPVTAVETIVSDPESGWDLRANPGNGLQHFLNGLRIEQAPGAAAMVKPMLAVTGGATTFGCYSGNFQPNDGDTVLVIEETSTGAYDIVGNSFSAPVAGARFLAEAFSDPLAAMANVDIAVTAVEDSVVAPGVDSAAVVGSYTGLTVGQVILLGGLGAPYDGLKTITRVDPTERKIEFAAVFIGTASGAIKITRFTTSVITSLVENESVEIASVSYNETQKTLFTTAMTFDMPIAFVTDDGAGLATVSRRDHTSVGIEMNTNGDAIDSASIGGVVAMGNTAITALAAQPAWTDLNLNALGVPTSDIERWVVTNSTTGEIRYIGTSIFNGSGCAKISAISSGSPQRFQFRIVKNGSPLPDGIVSTDGLTGTTDSLSVESPIVNAVFGDEFRVQVQNIDGLSSLIVEEFLFTTKKT